MSGGGFQDLRDRLAAFGFMPSKRFGQNFLVDPKMLSAIGEAAPVAAGDLVLEIGAGPGVLTRVLAERGCEVLTCEIDKRLCAFLRSEIPTWGEAAGRVRLLAGDAFRRGELAEAVSEALAAAGAAERGYACVSNLPYSVAGPAFAALLGAEPAPRAVLALCQLEMIERILAKSGGRDYGTLSVSTQLAWQGQLLRKVPPEVFRPRPRVDSGLILLDQGSEWLRLPQQRRRAFLRLLQKLFASRRKMLRAFLRKGLGLEPQAYFEEQGLPLDWLELRPEALSPEELWRLLGPCCE
ncbi:MAG: ribosomal RNA small subunit methyltransferase A [Planctomycetota bacterium]|nr:MAG: ribosomal RNA small subunit methyltransferase A [Planctomycetota bacterium]